MIATIAGFLAKPAVKYGGLALVAVALVLGALWYVDRVRSEGYAAGKAETEVQVITNTITIQREIQRAEDHAPRSPAAVSKRLRDGTF